MRKPDLRTRLGSLCGRRWPDQRCIVGSVPLYHPEPQLVFTRLTQIKCSSVMIVNKTNPLTLVSTSSPCAVVHTPLRMVSCSACLSSAD